MSHDRDNRVEALGCDASIVKNVWEIRLKETEAKMKQEEERQKRSALKSINEEWSERLAVRMGTKYVPKKQLERSATVDVQIDSSNAFASKQPLQPPPGFNSSRGGGKAGLGKPGPAGKPGLARSNTLPSPSVSKDKKKMPNKNLIKLQLLASIDQTQPSTMVWSKSWKYNKSLPKAGEGEEVASTWGQCWRLAVQQPYSEAVKPWPNGPNLVDYHGLRLFKNYHHRMIESHELDLDLEWSEWQMSWKDSQRQAGKSSQKGGGDAKHGMFSSLVETQHQNEVLCSSEWRDSWQSTKPQEESEHATSTEPKNGPIESPVAMAPKNGMPSSSWKFMHHQLHYKSKQSASVKNCNHPEWDKSWRAAITVTDDLKKPAHASSPMQHQKDDHDVHDNHEEPLHMVIVSVSRESKYRDWLKSLQCDQHKPLSEWKSSWEMTKNNSKPSEELEKVLKAVPAKTQVENVEKPKAQNSPTERTDPRYEKLRHEVIYQPRMQFTHRMLLRLRHLEIASSGTEWRDSWHTLKHYMRLERRQMRPHPSRPFREASKGGERKPDMSEWKQSWKYTNRPLNQEAELWQQGWPTLPRVRPDRAGEHNHFIEPMVMPKNGPGASHIWDDSWRMPPRPRHQPEVHHHHHQPGQLEQRRRQRPAADWQESWMVSDSQFHHDRPSLTQWMDAWRQSGFHAEPLHEQLLQRSGTEASIVIGHWRGELPLQKAKAKMSQSFDSHIFRERYPEKQWRESWKATCLLSCSSGMAEQGMNSHMQENSVGPVIEQASEWGMSFRIANPMPRVDKPWVQCSPNPSHHMVMFTRGTGSRRSHLFVAISKDHSDHKYFAQYFKIWGKSYRFLIGPSGQANGKPSPSKSKQQVDPWVLMTKDINMKKYLYANINHDSPDGKKWAGGHLLCKTQPRPKRSSAPVKKPAAEEADTTADDKFFEEWSESWRFVVRPQSLKKQAPVKNLSGWGDSWKFLLPPYPTQNGPMRKAM